MAAVAVPFALSRLLVWVAGVITWLVAHHGFVADPFGVTGRLGHVGNTLAAPAIRWDAVWYLTIAQHGYSYAHLTSFFPLYPLGIRALGLVVQSLPVAGILISMCATFAGLWIVFRLTELEFGPRVARAGIWLIAIFPMSFFLTAVYTEGLFLALSAGSIYMARLGRWRAAGVLGALAAATRNIGLLLIVPLLLFRASELSRHRDSIKNHVARFLSGGAAWLFLVPLGTVAYVVGLGLIRGAPFAMFSGSVAHRAFALPPVTVVRQITWSIDYVHRLLASGHHGFGLLYSGLPELLFLVLAIACLIGLARRLHPAYAAYTAIALLVVLSEPVYGAAPLTSFPRYILPLFPLWMWLASSLRERRSWPILLGVSALSLALFTGQFATWHFVA